MGNKTRPETPFEKFRWASHKISGNNLQWHVGYSAYRVMCMQEDFISVDKIGHYIDQQKKGLEPKLLGKLDCVNVYLNQDMALYMAELVNVESNERVTISVEDWGLSFAHGSTGAALVDLRAAVIDLIDESIQPVLSIVNRVFPPLDE